MRFKKHIAASFSIGALIWLITKSVYAGLICLLAGTLVDIDHIIEYIIHYGVKGFSLRKVYQACDETTKQKGELRFKRLYLVFHLGEVAVLLFALSIYTKDPYIIAAFLGYSLHLVMDTIGNKTRPYSMFLIWRAATGFDSSELFFREKADSQA